MQTQASLYPNECTNTLKQPRQSPGGGLRRGQKEAGKRGSKGEIGALPPPNGKIGKNILPQQKWRNGETISPNLPFLPFCRIRRFCQVCRFCPFPFRRSFIKQFHMKIYFVVANLARTARTAKLGPFLPFRRGESQSRRFFCFH